MDKHIISGNLIGMLDVIEMLRLTLISLLHMIRVVGLFLYMIRVIGLLSCKDLYSLFITDVACI